jgi:NADH-quinone oxidoreductase subunit N
MDMTSVYVLAPELLILVASMFLLVGDTFWAKSSPNLTARLSVLSLLGTAVVIGLTAQPVSVELFQGAFVRDGVADVLKIAMLLIAGAALCMSRGYLQSRNIERGEYYVLALISVLGMMVLASAYDLLSIFLGMEIMSLAIYAMIGMQKDSTLGIEAAMKYFVLGAMATGVMLYGLSLIYGGVGSLRLDAIYQVVSATKDHSLMLNMGLVFVLVGLAFKFGAAPFHMWVPDVYQGTPTGIVMFIATVPAIAAFALMFRLLIEGLEASMMAWQGLLIAIAVLSLLVGNITAIAQTNLKRMFAYSSITHMGFVILGFVAGNIDGYASAMFYVIVYAIMSLAGFGLIVALSRHGFEAEHIADFSGLGKRNPLMAFLMIVVLLSMAGIPPLLGFYAKVAILSSLVNAGLAWLAVFAVVMALIGAFYYLRVIKTMYFDEPLVDEAQQAVFSSTSIRYGLVAVVAVILVVGFFPGSLLSLVGFVMTY